MTPPLLTVRDLTIRFGSFEAAKKVSFDIAPGESMALVGESGCGKSTLGKTIMGTQDPSAGSITFEGREIAGQSPRAARAQRSRLLMNLAGGI